MGAEYGVADQPGPHTDKEMAASVDAASFSGTTTVIEWEAPWACRLRAVTAVPVATVTGNTAAHYNINIVDRGTDGLGVTELGNLDLNTGVNLTAHDSRDITLNATGLYRQLVKGQVISVDYEEIGVGLDAPPTSFRFHYQADHSND